MRKRLLEYIHTIPLLPSILFLVIFVIYFSSSMGLINSGDAPQFWTTEALIQNKNLNLLPFHKDPHYFIWPDFFTYKGQELSFRGYMLSIMMIPVHIVSRFITSFLSTSEFPIRLITKNFAYELTITSLFTLFSTVGLMFMYKLLSEVSKNRFLATIITFLFAYGTYIWKYSAYYARGGIVVFLLGIFMYAWWQLHFPKNKHRNFFYLLIFLIWSISFGIDVIFFISISFVLVISVIFKLFRLRNIIIAFTCGLIVLCGQLWLNKYWYNSFLSQHILQNNHVFSSLPIEKRSNIMLSSPPLATMFVVLFSTKPVPKHIADHFKEFPPDIIKRSSIHFASRYNFYGMFIISPFLFLVFMIIAIKLKTHALIMNGMLFTLFFLNIIGNSFFFTFWGGNQYDIRYFYPFVILLALPITQVTQYCHEKIKNLPIKVLFYILLVALGLFSLFMGWLGQINMFAPAQLGERKIWIEPFEFIFVYSRIPGNIYMKATFMNMTNWWISLCIGIVMLIFFYIMRYLWMMRKK